MSGSPAERLAQMRQDPKWRENADNVARSVAEQAAADPSDIDDKLADRAQLQPMQGGLPVEFVDDYVAPTRRLRGKSAPIVGATAGEIENYAEAPRRTCGTCRHFELRRGRQEIVRQKFLQRLVLEENWKLQHLGVPADHLGICGQKPSMATSTVTNAGTCPGYRARRG